MTEVNFSPHKGTMIRPVLSIGFSILALFYLSHPSACALDSQLPLAEISRVNTLPELDGELPDWVRARAPALELKNLLRGEGEPGEETKVWLLTDGVWLYVGVDCAESGRPVLWEVSEPGTSALFADDLVEVFIQGGGEHYHHFALSAGGAYRAQRLDGSRRDFEGVPDFETATSVRDHGWSAEFLLPLHMLWPDEIQGTPRFNITRTRQAPEPEQITWVDLANGRGGFHQPDRFGKLAGINGLVLPREARFRITSARISEPPAEENGNLTYPVRVLISNEGNASGRTFPVVVEEYGDETSFERALDPVEIQVGGEPVAA